MLPSSAARAVHFVAPHATRSAQSCGMNGHQVAVALCIK
jgi:hypothetical protein